MRHTVFEAVTKSLRPNLLHDGRVPKELSLRKVVTGVELTALGLQYSPYNLWKAAVQNRRSGENLLWLARAA